MDQRQFEQIRVLLGQFASAQLRSSIQIEQTIKAVEAQIASDNYRVASSHSQENYRKGHENLRNYTRLITAVGYGGVFAIWSSVQSVLCPWAFNTAGVLILFSVVLFAACEVASLIFMDWALSENRRPGRKFDSALNAAIERQSRFMRIPFWIQVTTGFTGAAIMVGAWVLSALPWRIAGC